MTWSEQYKCLLSLRSIKETSVDWLYVYTVPVSAILDFQEVRAGKRKTHVIHIFWCTNKKFVLHAPSWTCNSPHFPLDKLWRIWMDELGQLVPAISARGGRNRLHTSEVSIFQHFTDDLGALSCLCDTALLFLQQGSVPGAHHLRSAVAHRWSCSMSFVCSLPWLQICLSQPQSRGCSFQI